MSGESTRLVEQVNLSRKSWLTRIWPVNEEDVQEEALLPTCRDRVMGSRETWEWHWTASPFQARDKHAFSSKTGSIGRGSTPLKVVRGGLVNWNQVVALVSPRL